MPNSFWTKVSELLADRVPLLGPASDSWERVTTTRSRTSRIGLRRAKRASCSRSADRYSTTGMMMALHEHKNTESSGQHGVG
jgi:hypothetical protein